MKIQQLKCVVEVANQNLSVTAAAEQLFTSQPGVSKQIRLLEDELGIKIFERTGKHLSAITPAGQSIIDLANEMLNNAKNIHSIADEYRDEHSGSITIATTHTQARYALPKTIIEFRKRYPRVTLNIHQGSPQQIANWAARGEADIAIATEALQTHDNLIIMPCYHWRHGILVPRDHPLTRLPNLSLETLARHPLITYVLGVAGRSKLDAAFQQAKLEPNVILTAVDADVIKTYVRLGMGVGLVAQMAHHKTEDADLTTLPAQHLFTPNTSNLAFRRGIQLRGYMYDFIHEFAPHLTRETIDIASSNYSAAWQKRLAEIEPQLPCY